jgi:UbiD family decarboxylase
MTQVHDLRTCLDALREAGEVYDIWQEVDLVHELGAVLKSCERAGKAAFFHRVRGHQMPVVGGLLSCNKLVALALGCEPAEVQERMAAATEEPLPAELCGGPAACQEVINRGPVDLLGFPVPTHAPLDGGPFITAGVVVARDPDGDRRHNLSYNRMQVYGSDRAGVNINLWRHVRQFFEKV